MRMDENNKIKSETKSIFDYNFIVMCIFQSIYVQCSMFSFCTTKTNHCDDRNSASCESHQVNSFTMWYKSHDTRSFIDFIFYALRRPIAWILMCLIFNCFDHFMRRNYRFKVQLFLVHSRLADSLRHFIGTTVYNCI